MDLEQYLIGRLEDTRHGVPSAWDEWDFSKKAEYCVAMTSHLPGFDAWYRVILEAEAVARLMEKLNQLIDVFRKALEGFALVVLEAAKAMFPLLEAIKRSRTFKRFIVHQALELRVVSRKARWKHLVAVVLQPT